MSRCPRCNACESMWNTGICKYCGFPGDGIKMLAKKDESPIWAMFEGHYKLFTEREKEHDYIMAEFERIAKSRANLTEGELNKVKASHEEVSLFTRYILYLDRIKRENQKVSDELRNQIKIITKTIRKNMQQEIPIENEKFYIEVLKENLWVSLNAKI